MTEKKSIADALDVQPHDEGLQASADRAVSRIPVVGKAYDLAKNTAQDLGEIDEVSDLGQAAKSMALNGAKFVGGAYADALFFTMDPIGSLVAAGLDMLLELVQPLQNMLHYVSGDGPSLSKASDNFATIASGFVELGEDFHRTGQQGLQSWDGEPGEAAKNAVTDFSRGIKGIGSAAGAVSEVLQTWSIIMTVIEEVIKAIISELVSWLITIWLPALASSVISFGSSVAAAMTATVGKVASVFAKISRYLGKLGKLLDELGQFLVKLNGRLVQLAEKFRLGKTVAAGSRRIPLIGSKAAHDMFVPSRRVATTLASTLAGTVDGRAGLMMSKEALTTLATGAGIKAGIGAAKGGYRQGVKEPFEDWKEDREPMYDKSEIGGDRSTAETREDLQM